MLDFLSQALMFAQYHQIELAAATVALGTRIATKLLDFAAPRVGGW